MKELEVIKYLLEEIESEFSYKAQYEIEKEKAQKEADRYNKEHPKRDDEKWHFGKSYYDFIPDKYHKEPKKSIVKANAMKIRQLMFKLYDAE